MAAPQGTVGYTYNPAGQRTSMALPGARTVTSGYDPAGRMTTLTDWQSRQLTLGYNADGQRTTITRPNGVVTTKAYDVAGRLTGITHTGPGGATLKSDTSTLDAAGNRTAVTGSGGTETYTLDALGRITGATYANGDTAAYTYDANGNRLSWTRTGTNTGTTAYTYDDADQLLTEGSVTYTYDAAGNVTVRGGDSYTWDWANRLTAATVGGTTTSYAYDGDDVRVRKTTGSTTVTYLWDRVSGLPLLVDDGSFGYLHLDSVQVQIDAAGGAKYTIGDALGSVRGQTDAAGALVGSADYDVFGGVRASTGMVGRFGFTGEPTDAETGFVYLRARYYVPSSGRFLSADTTQPNAPGTQGFNLYAYVANNPTTWTDPTGHAVQPETLTGFVGVLAMLVASRPFAVTLVTAEFGPLLARAVAEPKDVSKAVLAVAAVIVACYLSVCPQYDLPRIRVDEWLTQMRRRPRIDSRQSPLPWPFPPNAVPRPGPRPDPKDCTVPGRWQPDFNFMNPRARLYEELVTGFKGWDYKVGDVKFDGCFGDVLVEAKGCGNADVWRNGKGIPKLRRQLERQVTAGRAAGAAAIVWFAAEAEAAAIVQSHVDQLGYSGFITVVHFPMPGGC